MQCDKQDARAASDEGCIHSCERHCHSVAHLARLHASINAAAASAIPTAVGALAGTYYLKYTIPAVNPDTHEKWERRCTPAVRTVIVADGSPNSKPSSKPSSNLSGSGADGKKAAILNSRFKRSAVGNASGGGAATTATAIGGPHASEAANQDQDLPPYFPLFFRLKNSLLAQTPRTDARLQRLCSQHHIRGCDPTALMNVNQRLAILAVLAKRRYQDQPPWQSQHDGGDGV
jgi:hypothetical protein